MKKLFISFLIILFFSSITMAFDTDYVQQSAVKSADANAILTGQHYLYKIVVMTDGTNDCTIVSYDALTATGTKLHPDWVNGTSADIRKDDLTWNPPLILSTGLSIDITVAAGSCEYMVYYRSK